MIKKEHYIDTFTHYASLKIMRTNYRIIITESDNTPNNFILHFLTVLIH